MELVRALAVDDAAGVRLRGVSTKVGRVGKQIGRKQCRRFEWLTSKISNLEERKTRLSLWLEVLWRTGNVGVLESAEPKQKT